MKYIRTKGGRIVKHPHPNAEVFTFRYEILKTADTIEELCDVFVYCIVRCEHVMTYERFKTLKQAIKWVRKNDEELDHIKGAIWTIGDHGEPILKSVAKLNDKGELELL